MHRAASLGLGFAAVMVLLAGPGTAVAADDAATGEAIFKKYCTECHALPGLDQNRIGPSLHGVVGRHAGQAAGYGYSSASLNAKIVWTERTLDPYLRRPRDAVPARASHPGGPLIGTKMTFKGIQDPAERRAVIAFLKAN
ncbi:MAG: c-type cytochrome [Rhodospirillaceae bacterium]